MNLLISWIVPGLVVTAMLVLTVLLLSEVKRVSRLGSEIRELGVRAAALRDAANRLQAELSEGDVEGEGGEDDPTGASSGRILADWIYWNRSEHPTIH